MAQPILKLDAVSSGARLVSRAAIRAGQTDRERIEREGWMGWIDSQLALPNEDDQRTRDEIAKAKLKIEYEAGEGHAAMKEDRPFQWLSKPLSDRWYLVDWGKKMGWEERVRPMRELIAATHIRTVTTEAQLRESVTDFWRDHFSVNWDSTEHAAIALPEYDQILREHAFGNFREMLEAVASSTTMLAYLNNGSSKASPANENYARELFELHALGRAAYLNDKFDRWREVPGANEGNPQGYIDQDVYEAARAFTGWTYASGQYISEGVDLPFTGAFTYTDAWHDPYQKRVLAQEFEPYGAPLADGRRVLDLAAFHPATARHVARRLCQRFVADKPSDVLVNRAAEIFEDHARDKNQLAKVIRYILLSDEFANAPLRLQRPLFLFASMQRAAEVVLPAKQDHTWIIDQMGQKLYNWHTPAGHPLVSTYWQSPGLLVRRWRSMQDLWTKIAEVKPDASWPSIDAFAVTWTNELGLDETHAKRTATLLKRETGEDNRAMSFKENERWLSAMALTSLTASPSFQAV